jgi:catechol 2,3-dioxygenase-like lactoylglutathione lyase family enzyme
MALQAFDHVNIRTARLAELKRFYLEVLGLSEGKRPPFKFPGAWIYCGGQAVVHLVGVSEPTEKGDHGQLTHFAFRASGMGEFLAQLRAHGVAYQIGQLPEFGTRQVNFRDPDGNQLHVDFESSDVADDLTNYSP